MTDSTQDEHIIGAVVWKFVNKGTAKHLLWDEKGVGFDAILRSLCGVKTSPWLPVWRRWDDDPQILGDLPPCRACLRVAAILTKKSAS